MASRKEQKEQARAARLAAEQTAALKARRTRRLRMLAGSVVIAVVVVGAAIAISIGGGTSGGLANGKNARLLSAHVNTTLAGIPQHATTLGDPHATYTLTFYGDLQCPICAELATGRGGGGLPQFITDQVRTGHAKVVYHSLCTATCNDFGESLFDEQQTAAYAAGQQNKFWYYEQLFYRQQGTEGTPYVTNTFLEKLAHEIPGLNVNTWRKDRINPSLLSRVQADQQAALRQLPLVDGGRGTPGLLMTGPRGTHFIAEGLVDYQQLQAAMKAVA